MLSVNPNAHQLSASTDELTPEELAIMRQLEALAAAEQQSQRPAARPRQPININLIGWIVLAGMGCTTAIACTLMLTNAMSSSATSDAINSSALIAHEAITSKARPNITCISFNCAGLSEAVQQTYERQPSPLPHLETLPDTPQPELPTEAATVATWQGDRPAPTQCSIVMIQGTAKEVCW